MCKDNDETDATDIPEPKPVSDDEIITVPTADPNIEGTIGVEEAD